MKRISIILIALFSSVLGDCTECYNGVCDGGMCSCRTMWTGPTCSDLIFDNVPGLFIFYRVFWAILFTAEMLLTLGVMFRAIQSNASYYHRVGFILIVLDCVVQILLYTLAPESTPGIVWTYVGAIINTSHFTIVYITFCVYLSLWIELNERHKRMHKGMKRVVKRMENSSKSDGVTKSDGASKSGSDSNSAQGSSTLSTSVSTEPKISTDSSRLSVSVSNLTLLQENSKDGLPVQVVVESPPPAAKVAEPEPPKEGEEPTGIRAIMQRGVSEGTLKKFLIFSCSLLFVSQVTRASLILGVRGGPFWGTAQYILACVVSYLGIIFGFELYKRAFLRALRESRKNEVMENLKKVTRTTIIIAIFLSFYGIIVFVQGQIAGWEIAMPLYFVRAVVTFITIGIYLQCFGGQALVYWIDLFKKILGFSGKNGLARVGTG